MSISSLIDLAGQLLGRDFSATPQTQQINTQQQGTRQTEKTENERSRNSDQGDRYTPSQAAAASNSGNTIASLQLEQFSFSAYNVTSSPTASTPATVNTAAAAPAVAQPNPVTTLATVPQAASVSTNAAPVTTAAPASSTSTQDQLQLLNAQLSALGLSPAEIQAFDQIAKLIQQFSPATFQDLVNQFTALAKQTTNQTSAPTASASASATAPVSAPASTSPASATPGNNSGGFQLTEISVKFSGLNETVTSSGQGAAGTGSTTQISAYNLQIQEVQVGLTNAAGQTSYVNAPQLAAAAAG